MSTSGKLKNDKFLTNLARAYSPGNLIGTVVAPVVRANMSSDKIFVDADDAINQSNDEAEGVPSNQVDFSVGTPHQYSTTRKAFSSNILDKTQRNEEAIVDSEMRETKKLSRRLKTKHENRVATILTDPTKVTQTKDVDATANARWDESTPVLETDIITAVSAIYKNSSSKANAIVMPFDAALYAANMDFIKDTLQYQHGMEVVTAQFQRQVMELVGLPPFIKGLRVIISDGRVNNANKGQTKDVGSFWGVDCLIGYIPALDAIEDQFGILTMEYERESVSKMRLDDPKSTKVLIEWDYDILEADLTNWYLLQNVINPA